jgi:hypothetical protein
MPASSLVRAAFFALGAAVGGGTVAVLNASKKKEAPSLSTSIEPAVTAVGIPKLPVVDMGVAGEPRFSAGVATAGGPILKYGNPGTHATVTAGLWIFTVTVVCAGPVSDQFVRLAYATGYDRRMRNPAWVSRRISNLSQRPRICIFFIDGGTFDSRFSREIACRGVQQERQQDWEQ